MPVLMQACDAVQELLTNKSTCVFAMTLLLKVVGLQASSIGHQCTYKPCQGSHTSAGHRSSRWSCQRSISSLGGGDGSSSHGSCCSARHEMGRHRSHCASSCQGGHFSHDRAHPQPTGVTCRRHHCFRSDYDDAQGQGDDGYRGRDDGSRWHRIADSARFGGWSKGRAVGCRGFH